MKRLKLIQRSIIIINICVLLLCSIVNGMDKPKPDPMFIVKGTDSDNGIDISQSTLEMSNTLADMIEGLGNDTTIPIPLNSTTDTIKSVFSILDKYKINPKDNSIQQMIASLSPQHLIQACNFVECLHLKDPEDEIVNNFINGLRQQLVALSPQEIEKNAVVINSLMSEMQKKIHNPLLAEIISNKKIELLKQNGIKPASNEIFVIDLGFIPTAGALSHNGKQVALGKRDGTIVIFDTKNTEVKAVLSLVNVVQGDRHIGSIQFSHDDKLIVTQNRKDIVIRDANTYEKMQSFSDPSRNMTTAALSPNKKFFATSANNSFEESKIIIWKLNQNATKYEKLYSIKNKYNFVEDFSSDGACVLLANEKEWASWDIDKKKPSFVGQSPIFPRRLQRKNLQFSRDNTHVIGLSRDIDSPETKLTIWDLKKIKDKGVTLFDGRLKIINLSPDSSMCLDLLRSNTIAISETATGKNICNIDVKVYGLLDPYIVSGFFSPDNNMIAIYNHISWKPDHPKKLLIAKLLTQKDQDELEKLKKLSFLELLKIIATKRKSERIEKEQAYFTKAVELKIFSLRAIAADIRAKIYSWWNNTWITKQKQ